jgi:hypothetical protein
MGNDGGSIPGRKDLVKEKIKEKRIENEELVKQSQSKYCALTKESLKSPIVGDKMGLLYNKESLIQTLIEKRLPKSFIHISTLKDIKDLNITFSEENKIKCPITMMEFSGINSFYFLWNCGCVISKKAIEELNMKDKCINCGTFNNPKYDFISLNLSGKEKQGILKKIIEEKKKITEMKNYSKLNKNSEKLLNRKRANNAEIMKERPSLKEKSNILNFNCY